MMLGNYWSPSSWTLKQQQQQQQQHHPHNRNDYDNNKNNDDSYDNHMKIEENHGHHNRTTTNHKHNHIHNSKVVLTSNISTPSTTTTSSSNSSSSSSSSSSMILPAYAVGGGGWKDSSSSTNSSSISSINNTTKKKKMNKITRIMLNCWNSIRNLSSSPRQQQQQQTTITRKQSIQRRILIGFSIIGLFLYYFLVMFSTESKLYSKTLHNIPSLQWELQPYSTHYVSPFVHMAKSNQTTTISSSSSPPTKKSKSKGNKLLLAQYVGPGAYSALLNVTMPVTQAYGQLYQYDYILCKGLVWDHPGGVFYHNIPTPSRSTYNKIAIVEYAIYHQYDYVLIMDADAMIYGFQYNILEEVPIDQYMMIAHRTSSGNINVGVTLWNLHHEQIVNVLQLWKQACLLHIRFGLSYDNDQGPLRNILHSTKNWDTNLLLLPQEFGYQRGRFVRHFLRPQKAWDNDHTDLDSRLETSLDSMSEICQSYNYQLQICIDFRSRIKYIPPCIVVSTLPQITQ